MISGSNVFAEEAVITLSCEIVANPKPTVTWLKRDTGELRRLMNSSRISIYNSYEGRTFTHQSILTIQHAQEADSGEYLCEVLNAPASLPIISSRHITISGKYHRFIILLCSLGLCKNVLPPVFPRFPVMVYNALKSDHLVYY